MSALRPDFDEFIARKRAKRFAKIDALPPEIRSLIHEYGYNVVHTLMSVGVTKPNRIKAVVETILDEFIPTRGTYANQGPRVKLMDEQ